MRDVVDALDLLRSEKVPEFPVVSFVEISRTGVLRVERVFPFKGIPLRNPRTMGLAFFHQGHLYRGYLVVATGRSRQRGIKPGQTVIRVSRHVLNEPWDDLFVTNASTGRLEFPIDSEYRSDAYSWLRSTVQHELDSVR